MSQSHKKYKKNQRKTKKQKGGQKTPLKRVKPGQTHPGKPVEEKPKPVEEKPKPVEEEPETITEASEGFFGELLEDAEDIFEPVTDAVKESTEDLLKGATNATAKTLSDSTDYVLDTLVGDEVMDKDVDEITGEVKEKLVKLGEVSGDLVTDPSLNDLLTSVGEDLGEMTKKVVHAAEEPLVKGTEAAMETAEKVVEEAGRGLVNTTLAATEGVLGEIPVVGGVLDLVLAFGKGLNTATSTFRGAIDNSEKFVTLANNVVGDGLDLANEGVTKFKDTKSKTDGVYNKIVQSIDNSADTVKNMKNYEDTDVKNNNLAVPEVPAQKGGKKKRRRKTKRRKKRKNKTKKKRLSSR